MSDSEQELISSCISGNFLKVKKLLHQGINPNTKNITTLKQDLSFEVCAASRVTCKIFYICVVCLGV